MTRLALAAWTASLGLPEWLAFTFVNAVIFCSLLLFITHRENRFHTTNGPSEKLSDGLRYPNQLLFDCSMQICFKLRFPTTGIAQLRSLTAK